MIRATNFERPPITEAIIDIRCDLPSDTNLDSLAEMHKEIVDRFPIMRLHEVWETDVHLNSAGPVIAPPVSQQTGFMMVVPDQTKIVQARLDGFSLNKLRPYTNWQAIIDEARELWGKYVKVARPTTVKRISVRYINRIEIPMPIKELKDYILTGPDIAPDCPQIMNNFFMRIVLPDPEYLNIAIVTEAIDTPPPDLSFCPLIFDVDVFREVQFDAADPAMWEAFSTLRETRNTIFFNSITDKTRELFQ